jgi:hypothetical protein
MEKLKGSYFKNEFFEFMLENGIKEVGSMDLNNNPFLQALGDYPLNDIPQFIEEEGVAELRRCSSILPYLILKFLRYKSDARDTEFFAMLGCDTENLRKSLEVDLLNTLCFRADLILTSLGYKVVELNVGTNLGGWDTRFQEEVFLENSVFQRFLHEEMVSARCVDPLLNYVRMLSCAVKDLDVYDKNTKSKIVIFNPNYDNKATDFVISILEGISTALDDNLKFVAVSSIEEITFQKAQASVNNETISGIVFPTRTWEENDRNFTDEILELWWDNKIILPENPVSITMGDKRVLASLWQERHDVGYSEDELKVIERYICESFSLLNCSLSLSELVKKKDNFVLKPGIGLQGDEVHVGKYTEQVTWEEIVSKEYGRGEFLIQKFEESVPVVAYHNQEVQLFKAVWGAFSFGLEYSGAWLRMSLDNKSFDGVINSSLGATESLVFELSPTDNV